MNFGFELLPHQNQIRLIRLKDLPQIVRPGIDIPLKFIIIMGIKIIYQLLAIKCILRTYKHFDFHK